MSARGQSSGPASAEAPATVHVHEEAENPVVRKLEVEVEPRRVSGAFDRAYRDLGRRVRLRGFRPGKAPRSVLEKVYGAALAEELERTLVVETLPDALAEAHLVPVSEPRVEASRPVPGEAFRYTARIEVRPEIELPDLRGLPVRRPRAELSDAEVDQELEALRQRHAVLLEEPPEVPVAPGHVATIDFEGRIDGKPFEGGSGHDVAVEIGSERFLPGFEEQLVGAHAGEDCTVRARFPEDHSDRELAGREAEFTVHVASVRRREVPALDDEFAKDVGDFESLAALRMRIREELEANRKRESEVETRRSLLDALLARASFPTPPGAVEDRLRRRLAMARRELGARFPAEVLDAELARWQEEWRPLAERELREQWVLDRVAEAEGIEVDEAELEAKLAEMARESDGDAARQRRAWREAGVIDAVRARMREDKTVDFLLREAKVEETWSAETPGSSGEAR